MRHAHKIPEFNVLHTVTCRAHLLVDLVATTNAVEHVKPGEGVREGGGGENQERGGCREGYRGEEREGG